MNKIHYLFYVGLYGLLIIQAPLEHTDLVEEMEIKLTVLLKHEQCSKKYIYFKSTEEGMLRGWENQEGIIEEVSFQLVLKGSIGVHQVGDYLLFGMYKSAPLQRTATKPQ